MSNKTSFKLHFNTLDKVLKSRNLEINGAVQKYVDSEVIRLTDPYVPMDTGALKKSAPLGTKIGSGTVIYNSVYAKRQYYTNAGRGKQGTSKGGLRGKYFFERMKADHLKDIIAGAKNKAGGK